MASKMIWLFLLGLLHVEHTVADPNEATNLGKAMAKAFVPAAQMPRLASGAGASDQPGPGMQTAMMKTLGDLEQQSQEMNMEYQRLRARIQKLPQADVEASVSASSSFRWLAGLFASVGLAASIGVAAVKKYTGQGQQGSESTTAFQIPLVAQAPQRAGPIVATVTVKGDIDSPAKQELKELARQLQPALGYYDPLGLSNQDYWSQGNDATIAWLRHAEIKHGRVAMAGFIGYCIHANHIHWPWKMSSVFPDTDWYAEFKDLSPADIWYQYPGEGRLQIILFMGFFEWWSENSYVLGKEGKKHYMRGGKPGYFPTFDEIPHPVPFNLFDPFGYQKNRSQEWKDKKLVSEINNGRLAMIGLMGLICESKIPGSVPPFADLGIQKMATEFNLMAPFGDCYRQLDGVLTNYCIPTDQYIP